MEQFSIMSKEELQGKVFKRVAYFFGTAALIASACFIFMCAKEYNPVVRFYTASGVINQPTRVWDGIVTVTTGTAQSVDISSAGFSSINSVTITPANNTGSTVSMPIVSIKSYTNNAVVFNTLVSNSGVVGLLVALVTPTSFSGMQVHVRVDGW